MITPLLASDIPAFEAGVQHERQRISSLIRARIQNLTCGPGSAEFVARKAELHRLLAIIREAS